MAINKIIYGGTTLIDLTADTVDRAHILYGYKAHDRSGAAITGSCTFNADTSDANATAAEILATATAYVNGNKIIGSMTNNGAISASLSTKTQQYTVPQGYHDGSGKVGISTTEQNKIIATNIKSGVTILGVEGTYSGEAVAVEANKNATPTTSSQVILPSSGYDYLAQVTVARIPYAESSNAYGTTVTIG